MNGMSNDVCVYIEYIILYSLLNMVVLQFFISTEKHAVCINVDMQQKVTVLKFSS